MLCSRGCRYALMCEASPSVIFLGCCRGSTGYGEDGIQSLPGNIGTNDVADCMTALDAAITEGKLVSWSPLHYTPPETCSPCLSLLGCLAP